MIYEVVVPFFGEAPNIIVRTYDYWSQIDSQMTHTNNYFPISILIYRDEFQFVFIIVC